MTNHSESSNISTLIEQNIPSSLLSKPKNNGEKFDSLATKKSEAQAQNTRETNLLTY